MTISQNDSGRAFEYGLAMALATQLPAKVQDDQQSRLAQLSFQKHGEVEKERIVLASQEASMFLIAHDQRLSNSDCAIRIQQDRKGKTGDVRDIVIWNRKLNDEIGISAKHRHTALKHSRLSDRIDFGRDWLGVKCSPVYFHQVVPIFRELNTRKKNGEFWKDIEDKHERYYMPVLHAFRTELEQLSKQCPETVAKGIVHYLLGNHDFYKVIKENGDVSISSFNVKGTLLWGGKIPLPTELIRIATRKGKTNTLDAVFDNGWQLSFRIHNAKGLIEPSLKFDIQLEGMPPTLSKHVIHYG